MPIAKTNGPILNATLLDSITVDGVKIGLPTYDDLMATYGRSDRGHRLVKGYEALLLTCEKQRIALEAIVQHQELIGGGLAVLSTTRKIAVEALK